MSPSRAAVERAKARLDTLELATLSVKRRAITRSLDARRITASFARATGRPNLDQEDP